MTEIRHAILWLFVFIYTVSNLRILLNALHPVRASWYNIGLQLNIPHTELDCFKKNFSDLSDSMREMLKHWLDTAVEPRPTWEAVVTALKSPVVDKWFVANELELKYCKRVQHETDESNTPTTKSEGNVIL